MYIFLIYGYAESDSVYSFIIYILLSSVLLKYSVGEPDLAWEDSSCLYRRMIDSSYYLHHHRLLEWAIVYIYESSLTFHCHHFYFGENADFLFKDYNF